MRRETLLYQDRKMNPNAIEGSIEEIARELTVGRAFSVTLEPGDATRYELLLVPMWERYVDIGNYHPEDEQAGLVVVRFRSGTATSTSVVLMNREYQDDTIGKLAENNEWTLKLLVWWFKLLYLAIEEARGNYSSHTDEAVRVDRTEADDIESTDSIGG